MHNSHDILLSLGSNVGDSVSILRTAIRMMEAVNVFDGVHASSMYSSEPWGNTDQQDFVNCCVRAAYQGNPNTLMELIQIIEQACGKKAVVKWGEREIDIDIILCGQEIVDVPDLSIPHPHFRDRKFVLQPACEIVPNILDPVTGKTMQALLAECTDTCSVYMMQ